MTIELLLLFLGLAAIGSAIAINAEMKEMAELKATEWILNEHSEFTSFSLNTLDFDAKKRKMLQRFNSNI